MNKHCKFHVNYVCLFLTKIYNHNKNKGKQKNYYQSQVSKPRPLATQSVAQPLGHRVN